MRTLSLTAALFILTVAITKFITFTQTDFLSTTSEVKEAGFILFYFGMASLNFVNFLDSQNRKTR